MFLCKLITNKFRVLNEKEFEDFMKLIIIKDLELSKDNINGEMYYSFNGDSDLCGIFNKTINKIDRLNFYSLAQRLQEFLNPNDNIIIKKYINDNVEATIITKKYINGVDLDMQIKLAIQDMI